MDNSGKILEVIEEVKSDLRILTVAVGGHPNIPDDRGMAGDIEEIKKEIKQVALNKSSIDRIWWWLGSMSLALVAWLVTIIRSTLTKG